MTILGIILSLVPPGLWFAWTETMLLVVVAVGVVSAAALVILADYAGSEGPEDPRTIDSVAKRRILADQSIAEIHRIFPLTYHHSSVEKTRFRQAMERVRRLLK